MGGEAQRGKGARLKADRKGDRVCHLYRWPNSGKGQARRGARLIQPERSPVGCDGSSTDKRILKGELGESVTPRHTDTVSIIRNTFLSLPDCN